MLLTPETLARARQRDHEVVYMKLDFANAYDMVASDFMFQAMRVTFHSNFIEMTKVLFQEASAVVNINGQASKKSRHPREGVHLFFDR